MGEEKRAFDLVVYADGQPVARVEGLQLQEVDTATEEAKSQEGGPVTLQWSVSYKAAAAAMEEITRQAEAARGAIQAYFRHIVEVWEEILLREAVRWAEEYNRPLAWRYHHAKKKRIRKKYAKRIMAWYRGD